MLTLVFDRRRLFGAWLVEEVHYCLPISDGVAGSVNVGVVEREWWSLIVL